jgi:hypothetical protein
LRKFFGSKKTNQYICKKNTKGYKKTQKNTIFIIFTFMLEYIHKQLEKLKGTFHLKSEAFADAIIRGIREKEIHLGEVLPPVIKASEELKISRKTVVTGYNILKERGIVGTRERVGYYIASENIDDHVRVLLILANFVSYLNIFYEALDKNLGKKAKIEMNFHHGNPKTLQMLLKDDLSHYDKIVVSGLDHPTFKREMKKIPPEKLILFSRDGGYKKATNFYIQDFYNGTYQALEQGIEDIRKYSNFYLLFNQNDWNFPKDIVQATKDFCKEYRLNYQQADHYHNIKSVRDSVFFVFSDTNLVGILERIEQEGLLPGKDAGLLSYNDTPVKRVIRQGITTVSTDFEKMGELVAKAILTSDANKVFLETKLIKRASL